MFDYTVVTATGFRRDGKGNAMMGTGVMTVHKVRAVNRTDAVRVAENHKCSVEGRCKGV